MNISMGNIKQIDIKNRTYYFFNGIINIGDFDSNFQKVDKKSFKNIDISYNGYITIKGISNYNSIDSVNPLYFVIDEVFGYTDQKMEIKT